MNTDTTTKSAAENELSMSICILLRDGRLFGPFPSQEAAKYWCVALDLKGYSTYDLISPSVSHERFA